MKAGRELDALVSKIVMGREPTWNPIPHYSTDFKAAWELREYIREKGEFDIIVYFGSVTVYEPGKGDELTFNVEGPFEEALCNALLLAKGF